MQSWKSEDLYLPSKIAERDLEEDRKANVPLDPSRATWGGWGRFVNRIFIFSESYWFTKYVREKLERVHEFQIARMTDDFGAITLL